MCQCFSRGLLIWGIEFVPSAIGHSAQQFGKRFRKSRNWNAGQTGGRGSVVLNLLATRDPIRSTLSLFWTEQRSAKERFLCGYGQRCKLSYDTNRCDVNSKRITTLLLTFPGIWLAFAGSEMEGLAEEPALPRLKTVSAAPRFLGQNGMLAPLSRATNQNEKRVWRATRNRSAVIPEQRVRSVSRQQTAVPSQQPVFYAPVARPDSMTQSMKAYPGFPESTPYVVSGEAGSCTAGDCYSCDSCEACDSCEEGCLLKKHCQRRWPGKNCWDKWVREPWRRAYRVQPAGCCESKSWYKFE